MRVTFFILKRTIQKAWNTLSSSFIWTFISSILIIVGTNNACWKKLLYFSLSGFVNWNITPLFLAYDTKNTFLKEKKIDIQKKLNSNQPTIPSTLGEEIKTNIFLRCDDPEIKHALGLKDSSEIEVFSKLRDLKDSF